MEILGIVFALLALLSWGFGDFFIQRGTRVLGTWKTLFYITFLGTVGLLPFIVSELPLLTIGASIFLIICGVVILFAAFFDFEAFRKGKIAIVEPVLALELPITVGLALILWHEKVTFPVAILIFVTFIGIILTITIHHSHLHYHKRVFEKGVLLAFLGALFMGLFNFLVGVGSQEISPLLTIWITNILVMIFSGVLLFIKQEFTIVKDFRKSALLILLFSIIDNLAWVFYALATKYIPIAVATTITESYIALTVLLGVYISKEKLKFHQRIGIAVVILAVICLAFLVG